MRPSTPTLLGRKTLYLPGSHKTVLVLVILRDYSCHNLQCQPSLTYLLDGNLAKSKMSWWMFLGMMVYLVCLRKDQMPLDTSSYIKLQIKSDAFFTPLCTHQGALRALTSRSGSYRASSWCLLLRTRKSLAVDSSMFRQTFMVLIAPKWRWWQQSYPGRWLSHFGHQIRKWRSGQRWLFLAPLFALMTLSLMVINYNDAKDSDDKDEVMWCDDFLIMGIRPESGEADGLNNRLLFLAPLFLALMTLLMMMIKMIIVPNLLFIAFPTDDSFFSQCVEVMMMFVRTLKMITMVMIQQCSEKEKRIAQIFAIII